MTFVDELNKWFTIPDDKRVIRHYKDANGNEIDEIIPLEALAEYNKMIENRKREQIESKALTRRKE